MGRAGGVDRGVAGDLRTSQLRCRTTPSRATTSGRRDAGGAEVGFHRRTSCGVAVAVQSALVPRAPLGRTASGATATTTTTTCRASKTNWRLSERDYPSGEIVLGMEIREHTVKAALVDTGCGEFVRPGLVKSIEGDTMDDVLVAVRKVVKAFDWRGPVGCSVTRVVWRILGSTQAERVLSGALPSSDNQVSMMIHTEAAAYAEMLCGAGKDNRRGRVLILTVGKNLGAVVYENGQKVRDLDVSHLFWKWEMELEDLQRRFSFSEISPPPPSRESKPERAWLEWTKLCSKFVGKICDHVKPTTVVMMPTGMVVKQPRDRFLRHIQKGVSPDVEILVGTRPEGAIIRGAAIGANMERVEMSTNPAIRHCLSATEVEEVVEERDECLVFVSGQGCKTCAKVEEPFAELASTHEHIDFVKLNVDTNRSTLSWTRKLKVERVPCFLFYRNGELVERANDFNLLLSFP